MTEKISAIERKSRAKTDSSVTLGLLAVLLFFVVSGFVSFSNTRILTEDAEKVTHTHEVISTLDDLLSLMKDAETGQRGFILTNEEKYLDPYNQARARIEERLTNLEQITRDNPIQANRVDPIRSNVQYKFQELEHTIELRRTKGFASAVEMIATDRGKQFMDSLREEIAETKQEENDLRLSSLAEMKSAYRIAIISGLLTCLIGILLSCIIGMLIRRAVALRRRQMWLQSGEVGLSNAMLGNQSIEQIGESVLKFLCDYFDAHGGAFFVKDNDSFRRIATYGIPEQNDVPERFHSGEGLMGQAAKDGKAFIVNDVPENYITIGSALGHGKPRNLAIAPAMMDHESNAVFELGFIHPLNELTIQLLDRASESIGVAVRSANYRAHLQNLLEETQRQSEELQAQGEELRVSNEELEEQSRALKESSSRLEEQQAELEQTNAQLEEQAQLLESQKDDLTRSNAAVQLKAQELEQASQYKSDFLANMSHELRTPLNSSLILAKLLADNPNKNLTDEQVKFAQTIQNSGNDLLALINDILDLSKIEAGHMEVRTENVSLGRLTKDLERTFDPLTIQKGLRLTIKVAPGCPETIETDKQRIEQVLKNLLSNAIKFTEKGSIELAIGKTVDGRIAFAVTDTGIGISPEQQETIFEAFRQADGTISRKYGGTGLGLSISRQLARLLGGAIELKSKPGKGSTFILTLPDAYDASLVLPRIIPASEQNIKINAVSNNLESQDIQKKAASGKKRLKDDRDSLAANKRSILVIEDDEAFAKILFDLSHELGFQCLLSTTAEDALIVARQYMPSAVVLDVGLPDHSGLSVLDRLKRDSRTRHIPVHVVSANDYTQTAMSLGAAGYMIKPVKRNQLVDAMKNLESKFAHHVRRVLIVEDDPVQQDSVRRLLGSHDVETVGVGTAAECLKELKSSSFDCMVLDLSLPDSSGYTLLETLSKEDAYSFPPVIVYTGRDLSTDEEQLLRRYSKSIIIKGAKSPERLLDEVTLFLHQVVSDLPLEQQKMLERVRNRDEVLEGRKILVVEDDITNVYALTSILEPRGAVVKIARNGREALEIIEESKKDPANVIDLVLMDMMMPEMDGLTATKNIRKQSEWKKLPIIMLTAKAMRDDQERCLEAGANDYMAKPLDVEKLLSLVRVWMPR